MSLKRLLITGAAGGLGKVARQRLGHLAEILRLSDIADLGQPAANEEIVTCDLADAAAVDALVQDCDGILHLGGISVEDSFSRILDANIVGLRNLYEAARAHGQPRIFFASSNHVVGQYRQTERVDFSTPYRPDSLYGVSKCFGEALAQFYYDKLGQETAVVRIGSCFEEPTNARMLATWLSYDDFVRLVERVFAVQTLGCPKLWAISNNSRALWRLEDNEFDWQPRDSADRFEAQVRARGDWPGPDDPLSVYHGGNHAAEPVPTD